MLANEDNEGGLTRQIHIYRTVLMTLTVLSIQLTLYFFARRDSEP